MYYLSKNETNNPDLLMQVRLLQIKKDVLVKGHLMSVLILFRCIF